MEMKQNKTVTSRKGIYSLWRYREDYLFMMPFLVIFFIFTIIPVVASILLSFSYFNVLESPRFIGLDNYFRLFLDDKIFIKSLINTVILSIITGPVGFFLCLLMGWVMNEFSPKVRAVLTLLLYAPSISGSVYLIWQLIYSGDAYGMLNSLLMRFNLINEPIQWLTDPKYMMAAAIVVILWTSLGTSFLSFIAGFQNVDRKLYEAGAVDGIRNRWQELWFITLPSMRPQLMFGAVISITASFGMGEIISGLFGFPSTNYTLQTMVHQLQDYGTIRFEMGYASAIATILFLIMIGANRFVQKLLMKMGD